MSKKFFETVKVWHLAIGLLITILGGAASAGALYANNVAVQAKVEVHDGEIRELRKIREDVAFIRGYLESKK